MGVDVLGVDNMALILSHDVSYQTLRCHYILSEEAISAIFIFA